MPAGCSSIWSNKRTCIGHSSKMLLLQGAKLSEGHIPLYCSGLNPKAKQFASRQAVQNHMKDVHKFMMLFDENEEEYEDYYDLDALYESDKGPITSVFSRLVHFENPGLQLANGGDFGEHSGFELSVRDEEGRSKVLGNREFAYLYRQRHRPWDGRESIQTGQLVAKYRALGIRTREVIPAQVRCSRKREAERRSWTRMKTDMRSNINSNLPRNVPY